MALSLFLGNNNQQMFFLFNHRQKYFSPVILCQPAPIRHTTGLVLGSVIALESPSPSFFPPIRTVCYYTHYLHFSVLGGRFSPPAAHDDSLNCLRNYTHGRRGAEKGEIRQPNSRHWTLLGLWSTVHQSTSLKIEEI